MILFTLVTLATMVIYLAQAFCPTTWIEANSGKCVQLSTSSQTYNTAVKECAKLGSTFPVLITNQSEKSLHKALDLNNVKMWTEFQILKNDINPNTAIIMDITNSSHVTYCLKCNQLEAVFLSTGLASSCVIVANFTDSGADWMLSPCNKKYQYACEKDPDPKPPLTLTSVEIKDYAAIACGAFLLLSLLSVILISLFAPKRKSVGELYLENENSESTLTNSVHSEESS